MRLLIPYYYKQCYLPTRRHRKVRTRHIRDAVHVDIAEPTEHEFPIAFIVMDYGYYYEDDNKSPDHALHTIEIRTYNGMLWRAVRYSERVSHGAGWMPVNRIWYELSANSLKFGYSEQCDTYSENPFYMFDDRIECRKAILNKSRQYIVFENKVWIPCGEPMYCVQTFGLGHNHGGTGFFIEYNYNENIPAKNYFNALERDEAIQYGVEIANRRGDTESIDGIEQSKKHIEVVMPEMVKRNPASDHGGGDSFMNALEGMIEETDSAVEAGLLAIAMCNSNK